MHITDGLRASGIYRKAVILLVLLPFLLIGLHCIQVSANKDFSSQPHVSLGESVLVAGVFHYLDVTVPVEHERIFIIAYTGASEPELQARSEHTYYRWEYDNGVWKDASGHDSSYIDPSHCYVENTTYSFYIGISHKAKPGSWTFKIIVDNQDDTSSISYQMTVGSFCLFFSTIIGVFEPMRQQKSLLIKDEGKCCFKQREMKVSEENIERIVDSVINRKSTDNKDEQSCQKNNNYFCLPPNPVAAQEPLRYAMAMYPRSKLREIQHQSMNTFFLNKTPGAENGFNLHKSDGMKRFFIIVMIALLLSASVLPMVVLMGKNLDSGEITILNIQSYPLVGGTWTVLFTTVGQANLTISAVNGTTWSNINNDNDLRFSEVKKGNETMQYQWVNNSVFIPDFSSNVTCYGISEVLTPGPHTLMFQFGDEVAFANNLASENWLQTSTSDFNNGTKYNINVSDDSFHLMERYLLRNFTLIDNESFEGSWPPAGWSEDPSTSNWNNESNEVYHGNYSADFYGVAGGASGNLLSPPMNCSGSNVTAIYVNFWGYSEANNRDYYLDYYNGTSWNQITRLDNLGSGNWAHYSQRVTDLQYFTSNFQIRWRVVTLRRNANVYVDLVNVTVERNESGYYSTGSLLSQAFDTTRNLPDYNNIFVNKTTPSGTTVTTWVRAADTQSSLASAIWYTNITQVPQKRWVQWRINLTGDTYLTPTINEVNLTWTYDNEAPLSTVNSFIKYWQNTTPFQITATASDNGTGVKEVALYYNYSATNTSDWSGWTLYGANATTIPYSWSFLPPHSDGYYRFYSRAVDWELNVESPPSSAGYDAFCGVDTIKPSSKVDMITSYWCNATANPLLITVTNTTDELSGIKNVSLYYRYRKDNASIWDTWMSFNRLESPPWVWYFDFPDGEGRYQFYSIAHDHAGNEEEPPSSPDFDTECGYDTSKPLSQVDFISPYTVVLSPLFLNATASDDVKNVTLWYYYSAENSTWWNPNWQYRKQLSIANRNEGYHMKIIIGNSSGGDVNCSGHARSDFGDIRFISHSNDITELCFWLKNYTAGAQATFWVNNSLNDSSIWMYYGNQNASTTSDGNATFYFFDDFSNGLDKWVMDSWNADSILINQNQGNPSPALIHLADNSIPANRTYQDTRIRTASYKIQDGIIEYDLYLAGTPRIIHQFGWRANSLSWTNGYCWRLQSANSDGGFFRFTGPTAWTLLGASFPNAVTGTWYHVQINVSGANYVSHITPPCGGASTRTVTDSTKLTSDYLVSHVHGVNMDATNYVLLDNVLVRKYHAAPPTWESFGSEEVGYQTWINSSNPDTSFPWNWSFNFPDGYGYYWFYSIAIDFDGNQEDTPNTADAWCQYVTPFAPVINSYDLRNISGSKLNNITGLLDVNKEYYFIINVTIQYGWVYLDYIDIKAWYDHGNESSFYNQTAGGNLNMHLRYENTTGAAHYKMLWPNDEVQLVSENCSETIVNSTTRIIMISFRPLSQIRWACSNNTWDVSNNITNNPYSWNFNITAMSMSGLPSWITDEYGVYKYAMILPETNWVDVRAPPGYTASTNIVNVTYSSNYDFNISLYFENNLTNASSGDIIPIANNVFIRGDADLNDDIITDMMFKGIGEINAIQIINISGIFNKNNSSQIVRVQFNVYIPFGTIHGEYSARVATKIKQKEQ